MIVWPAIVDATRKTLSEVALELALWCEREKIREHGAANRGSWVDESQRAVGLAVPADPTVAGWPWCTAAGYVVFAEAARQKRCRNPFPKTAKAVTVYDRTEPICRITNPRHGSTFVLSHGKNWATELGTGKRLTDNGHFGWDVWKDGRWWTLSANTNTEGSREGNCWALHPVPDGGGPETVHGGVLLGRLDFDLASQPPPGFAA